MYPELWQAIESIMNCGKQHNVWWNNLRQHNVSWIVATNKMYPEMISNFIMRLHCPEVQSRQSSFISPGYHNYLKYPHKTLWVNSINPKPYLVITCKNCLTKVTDYQSLPFSELFFFFIFFLFFYFGFTVLSRIFHFYQADYSSKAGENERTLGRTTRPSVSRTSLSHMWPERGSNHSCEKTNGLRVSSLIHQATGARPLN